MIDSVGLEDSCDEIRNPTKNFIETRRLAGVRNPKIETFEV